MSAKANILAKLRNSLEGTQPLIDDFDEALVTEPWRYAPEQRVPRLRQLMEAVHTETHLTTLADWPALLERLLTEKQLGSLLIAPSTPWGAQLAEHFAGRSDAPHLKAYDRPVEEWKAELFNDTPASLTGTLDYTTLELVAAATNTASLSGSAFSGASGNIGVNVSAGTGNQQANSLSLAVAQPSTGGGETPPPPTGGGEG